MYCNYNSTYNTCELSEHTKNPNIPFLRDRVFDVAYYIDFPDNFPTKHHILHRKEYSLQCFKSYAISHDGANHLMSFDIINWINKR